MEWADLPRALGPSRREPLRGRLDASSRARRSWADTLFGARYGCYLALGFDERQAFWLATAQDVSVMAAVELVERDCPHELALAILF